MYRLHAAPDFASTVPHMALVHLGVPFDLLNADIDGGALDSPAYRAINPLGLIPAMETPDGPVFETAAILLYLDERHPGTLGPVPGDGARAAWLTWFTFVTNTIHPLTMLLVHPERAAGEALQAQASAHVAGELADRLGHLDRALAADPALGTAGIGFYLAVLFRWAQLFAAVPGDAIDAGRFPAIRALAARTEALPAAIHVAQSEGLGATPFSAPKG
ncbi:MAG: glutathione S-transferase family protein [Gemmobacter sp.]